ncbi:MAG: hypothetical protein KF791_19190 [Verrucomicrobiae bacterium]|nr:hypothetical protein [Verrucomicrobiae bacterium]
MTVAVEHTEEGAEGELLVDGRADGDPDSTVALSLGETGVSGTVNLGGGGHFHLTSRGDSVEVRKSLALPPGGCATDLFPVAAVPSGSTAHRIARSGTTPLLPAADTLPDPTVIDVLFLYTPLAISGAGSEVRLQQKLLESIETTHRIYTNSGINVRLNPIRMELINYTESGSTVRYWWPGSFRGSADRSVPCWCD